MAETAENRLEFIDCRRSFERFHTAWVKVRRSGTSRSTTGAPPTTELLTDRPAQPFRANSRLVQSCNPEADNLQRQGHGRAALGVPSAFDSRLLELKSKKRVSPIRASRHGACLSNEAQAMAALFGPLTCNSCAALLKLRCRTAASNARRALSGGMGLCMRITQLLPEKRSFVQRCCSSI